VQGYRGLVRELIMELKRELKARRLPVVATGGYARLIAAKMPEITVVDRLLTLEGLRLVWLAHQPAGFTSDRVQPTCNLQPATGNLKIRRA